MRSVLIVIICIPAVLAFGQTKESAPFNIDSFFFVRQKMPLGKPYPRFEIKDGKTTYSIEQLKGKVVLINFWFEGCHPCMTEMSALNDLYHQLKHHEDFEFISFTWDNDDAIKRVRQKYNIAFKVIKTTDDKCRELLFQNGYPTSIILDRSGIVRYLHSGGAVEEVKAREFVQTVLRKDIESLL